jgi:hypothetical protein
VPDEEDTYLCNLNSVVILLDALIRLNSFAMALMKLSFFPELFFSPSVAASCPSSRESAVTPESSDPRDRLDLVVLTVSTEAVDLTEMRDAVDPFRLSSRENGTIPSPGDAGVKRLGDSWGLSLCPQNAGSAREGASDV